MFFDLHDGGERARYSSKLQSMAVRHEPDLGEFIELVRSAGGEPASVISGSRRTPTAKYFIGQGKLDEIKPKRSTNALKPSLVVFNHVLSPSQERNLEAYLCCRVIARTGLILDIFAQRARTHEGKLQVELAQLKHISTRLIRGWTHLERQKGGIGLRGPGETQLETDRRLTARACQHDRISSRQSAAATRTKSPGTSARRGPAGLAGGLHQCG